VFVSVNLSMAVDVPGATAGLAGINVKAQTALPRMLCHVHKGGRISCGLEPDD